MKSSNANYIKQLTFLRFLAALWVVLFHFAKDTSSINDYLSKIIHEGSIAVSFFFFLSGTVLGLNYFYKSNLRYKPFILKRISRIYPLYLFAFIASLLLAMLVNGAYPKGISIVLQALALHAWIPGISLEINFPAWSIAVEFFFYITFPFLAIFLRKYSLSKITLITLIVWVLCVLIHILFSTIWHTGNKAIGQLNLYFPLWHIGTFLSGILCGLYIKQLKSLTINRWLPKIVFLIGLLCFTTIITTQNDIKPYIHNGLLSPIYFAIILSLALDNSIITQIFGSKPLVFLGNISFAIYILQWPVYLVFLWLTKESNIQGIQFYLYIASLLVISTITYLTIEIKGMTFLRNKWGL